MLARCIIGSDGTPTDCHIVKGLPFVNEAVLRGLQQRHYRPAMFQGRPVRVAMVITVRMRMSR